MSGGSVITSVVSFSGLGVAALVGGWWCFRASRRAADEEAAFLTRAVRVQARVVGVEMVDHGTPNDSSWLWHPVVDFCTPDNRVVRAMTANGTAPAPVRPGDVLDVAFDPARPDGQVLALTDWGRAKGLGTFYVVFGTFAVMAGVVCLAIAAMAAVVGVVLLGA